MATEDENETNQLDESSIKAVSSLRSQFENINASSSVSRPAIKLSNNYERNVPEKTASLATIPYSSSSHTKLKSDEEYSLVNVASEAKDSSTIASEVKKQPPLPPPKRRTGRVNETESEADRGPASAKSSLNSNPALPGEQRKGRPPPPVKRNTKPVIPGNNVLSTHGEHRPLVIQNESDAATTVPSSLDEESDFIAQDHPPPLPLHSKPNAAQMNHNLQEGVDDSISVNIFEAPFEEFSAGDVGNNLSIRSTAPFQNFRDRPTLPPRDQSTIMSSRPETPLCSTPVDTVRPSPLTQGFVSAKSLAPSRSTTPNSHYSTSSETQNQASKQLKPPQLPKPRRNRVGTSSRSTSPISEWETKPAYQSPPDFPKYKNANRRPPHFSQGPRNIATGYDLRLIDVCGEYVCAAGPVTRVWNILNGKLLMSMTHGEGLKVTAISFRPSRNIEHDGTRIWLGMNTGDLIEIDWTEKRLVAKNSVAHARREIVKIYRNNSDLWTLDNEGKLFMWSADDQGCPNLFQGTPSARGPRNHSASVMLDGKLWIGSGREVRVLELSPDLDQTKTLVPNASSELRFGEITCCSSVPEQPDKVYFGHSDGKISVYSRTSLACIETITVSQNKVYCMAGTGNRLWVGYGNGRILTYDVGIQPWNISKEWRAHDNLVASIIVDHSSIWKIGRLQIVSLGIDTTLKIWDGMMSEDWLESEMLANEEQYTTSKVVTAKVLTWNIGAITPNNFRHEQQDSNLFRDLMQMHEPPDIFVVGLQELVNLEDKALTAKSFFKSKKQDSYGHEHLSSAYRAWRDYVTACLEKYSPTGESYVQLHSGSLVGLFSCVFAKQTMRNRIRNVHATEVKTGLGGLHGNKGAIIVRFTVDDSSLCLINCHLAAGQTKTLERNNDVGSILESAPLEPLRLPESKRETLVCGGDGSMVLDHEICILSGDLNYRIDTMTRDTIVSAVRSDNFSKLLDRDQLLLSCRRNPTFKLRAFEESMIKFAPTYKYDPGTNDYDSSEKRRAPAWCDRILIRGRARIVQLDYGRHEVCASDHRPVTAFFKLRVKSIHSERRTDMWTRTLQSFETYKEKVSAEAKLQYLTRIFGMSNREAENLLVG